MKITVPTRFDEIPLSRFARILPLIDSEEPNSLKKIVCEFCGIDSATYDAIPITKQQEIADVINTFDFNASYPLPKFVTTKNYKLGFIPDLNELRAGELADIATFLDSDICKAMCILFRPIVKETQKLGGLYTIEPYKVYPNSQPPWYGELCAAPASTYLGARAFFLNGSKILSAYIRSSSILHSGNSVLSKSRKGKT